MRDWGAASAAGAAGGCSVMPTTSVLIVQVGRLVQRITLDALSRQAAISTALELMGTGARVVACGREGQW